MEAVQEKARAVKGNWALTHSAYLQKQPVYDPEAFLARLKPLVFSGSPESFHAAIKEVLVGDIYELIGKMRNACAAQVTSYLPKCAVDLAWYLALVVGLAQRHCYTKRSLVLPEALSLPDLPQGFAPLCELVMQGDLRDYRLVVAAWQGI
ncbi:hypothetical protein KTAU_08550 [Thermogemmatispora aurantia]|uniref:Kanamycin nucleotidyltransferase C-terminal domain-containing protein n=1 Tax=Thermogemmatispora aurantia TaxID=2045279 RepID=A0A5J4K6C9_9CHLR|nr:kanamycin nucleotidyltransferase C-terminal domain-containing protein [Thermogemmatispora aurantia]GER82217.1 hypothetical protein KTAU_08550 [Thermogemmatispora aurantia]